MALPRRHLFIALALAAIASSTSVVPAASAGAAAASAEFTSAPATPPTEQRDVLVHGGTPAGVTAAIAAAGSPA